MRLLPASSRGHRSRRSPGRQQLAHFKNALAKVGLPAGFRTHDLRHSFTSNRLADGVALTDVAMMVGHGDFRTTARYTHRVKEKWGEDAKLMEATYAAATAKTAC
ncbi:tyrosine-type recombinase/integrase [Nonomuraea wenchangensis]|uniref:tyrosine-type recombinase/integrase n=1 Tax=Nonomuraea wenchangensis TaxID=568860 RepID=UPI003790875B